MPTKYIRISGTLRGNWSEEQLQSAMSAVFNGVSTNMASKTYGVPRKTLERRLKSNNNLKGNLGPQSCLGSDNEKKLSGHIKELQKKGFPLTRDDVRRIAYDFANQLNIKHNFNNNEERAGYDWLNSFLRRNTDLSVRKAEGVSLARGKGMTREVVHMYFELLLTVLQENDFLGKPGHIFNMDETGLQLNNKSGHVIAAKGVKDVASLTSAEKGETITVVTCCSAEGVFLPPVCIFKGKNKKQEFENGMPPGATVYMSEKSAYVNAKLFLEWLQHHFIPRKPHGKVLLMDTLPIAPL